LIAGIGGHKKTEPAPLICQRGGALFEMRSKKPIFAVGDEVCERFPFARTHRQVGIVVKCYDFQGQYRYVVRYESGPEKVFFERELLSVAKSKKSSAAAC